jgi:hypothetical protein
MNRFAVTSLVLLCFIAVSYQTPVNSESAGDEEVIEDEIVPETVAPPPAATTQDTAPVKKPTSSWGGYYNLNRPVFEKFFEDAFLRFKLSPNASESLCGSTARGQAEYSRYYNNIDNGEQYILSYWCGQKNAQIARGYEHILVSANKVEGEDGSLVKFDNIKFIDFYKKLSAAGISAGDYADENTLPEGEEARRKVQEVFDPVKDDIEANLPDGCKNASFSTKMKLQKKTENDLDYWKFPISCTIVTKDDTMTEVEVFKDNQNNYVNDGKYTLSGFGGIAPNAIYFILKEEEEKAKEEEAKSALQSGATYFPTLISLALLPLVRLL